MFVACRLQRLRYAFLCPTHGHVARLLTVSLSVLLVYGALWGITGPEALPHGNLFALCVLAVCSYVAGLAAEKMRLPPLVGMFS